MCADLLSSHSTHQESHCVLPTAYVRTVPESRLIKDFIHSCYSMQLPLLFYVITLHAFANGFVRIQCTFAFFHFILLIGLSHLVSSLCAYPQAETSTLT